MRKENQEKGVAKAEGKGLNPTMFPVVAEKSEKMQPEGSFQPLATYSQ